MIEFQRTMKAITTKLAAAAVLLLQQSSTEAFALFPCCATKFYSCASPSRRQFHDSRCLLPLQAAASSANDDDSATPTTSAAAATDEHAISKAPTLNGKIVLPLKTIISGLRGHQVAAVYALIGSNYKRGSGEGWEHVQTIGITKDLARVLNEMTTSTNNNNDDEENNYNKVAQYVRALSFTYPQKAAMEDFASNWRNKVQKAQAAQNQQLHQHQQRNDGVVNGDSLVGGGTIATIQRGGESNTMTVITVGDEYEFDDEDMDEDDLDDYLQMMAESRAAVSSSLSSPVAAPLFVDSTLTTSDAAAAAAIISPFESNASITTELQSPQLLELTKENVNTVLEEVRPYLISDGGNVSVQNVDITTGNVYLVLEGACGSCSSSTVTMQMGIERVLKEKFGERLCNVIQVDPNDVVGGSSDGGGKPNELTMEAVQSEVKRVSQAIIAMGGVVRVRSVDPIGVVEIEFRGPNKVKRGLELALLDVEYVKHVKFVS